MLSIASSTPHNHLGVRHQLDMLGLVRRLGLTSIVALHDLNFAVLFCDEIAVLDRGRLVCAGAPAEVLTAETIHAVFRVHAQVSDRAIARITRVSPSTMAAIRRAGASDQAGT